jgi:hypothetical protein
VSSRSCRVSTSMLLWWCRSTSEGFLLQCRVELMRRIPMWILSCLQTAEYIGCRQVIHAADLLPVIDRR